MSLSLTMAGVFCADASNIQTKNVAEGGYASVTFNVNRKLEQSLFDTFTDVMTFDEATGEQTGGGRLLEQGRNDDGTWSVTCLGEGLASMQDRTTPTFYVDQMLENWFKKERSSKRLDCSVTQYPGQTDDDPVFVYTTTETAGIPSSSSVTMLYPVPELCDMQVGGVQYRHKEVVANSDVRVRCYVGTVASPYGTQVQDDAFANAISSTITRNRNGDFSGNATAVSFRWFATGSVTAATVTDDYWSAVRDVIVRAQIYGTDGNLRTVGYSNGWIYPHEVFTDWVVRYCPRLTVVGGTVDTSSAIQIDQLCYLDGVHGMQLMDDVQDFEPALTWQVWDQDPTGKWPAYYQPLPTSVQYEASVDDGFQAPSPTNEILNKVTVTGKTAGGRDMNLTVTSAVPVLDNAGIPREVTIPLGSETWSTSGATKAANKYLAEHAVAPNAGTLTVARKILDNNSGRWIKPSSIRAGGLIRVRGIQPTPDTLNATSPDGVTVFRIVSATYDNDSGAATLELDTYELTTSRAIAKLSRARSRRGAA